MDPHTRSRLLGDIAFAEAHGLMDMPSITPAEAKEALSALEECEDHASPAAA